MLLNKNLLVIIAAWAAVWALIAAVVPLLPIDETRYLTVAWEMRLQNSWILPTLNFAPYSHKPPLLFWLINAVWTVTGPAVWSARIVPFMVCTLLLCGTFVFARRLFPDRPGLPALAALTFAASPFLYIYGGLIMFDMLNSLIALCAAICVWRAAQTQKYRWLLLWGVAVGFGVLAKGPVILIYTIFPVLCAPLWSHPQSLVKWYGTMFAGILVAASIGLSWAVPAAVIGGPEYAQMIFWKQSAGRMVSAFDHQRSALFYLPVLPALFLPLFLWPTWWRAMRESARDTARSVAGKFLLSWAVPPFICLLLISGKQVHYLVPLLPALAIFFAAALDKNIKISSIAFSIALPSFAFAALIVLALTMPFVAPHISFIQNDEFARTIAENINPFVAAAALAATAALYALSRRSGGNMRPLFLSLITAVFFAHFIAQAAQRAFEYYDLAPVAQVLQAHKDRPMAFVRNYEGQIGFVARLEKPLTPLTAHKELAPWFDKNPDGIAIVRFKDDEEIAGYNVLFRAPYRSATRFMAVVEK